MTMDHIKVDQELYDNQLHVYEKFYPEYLEQIRGMAEGGKFDLKKIDLQRHHRGVVLFQEYAGIGTGLHDFRL